ncbi:MAG: 2-hydroxyacid dehydrogenase [Alphaproteobacteria bacterium]|nr:2-hydroxyacid dehydrogenase [Alphaproteobacteria bacterium]
MAEILAVANIASDSIAALEAEHRVHRLWEAPDRDALLASVGPRVQAVFTSGLRGADAALLARLPALRIVCCFGSGYENVDLAAARARGIAVTHSPGANAPDVADMAWALLLAAARRVGSGDRLIRLGGWTKAYANPVVPGVLGRRLGIIGLGAIGSEVAKRAAGFDMEVRYHNPRPREVPFARMASPLALADWADILVVSCRASPATQGIVDGAVLRALGPQGVLVNVARGSVVDEAALIAALRDGVILAAGLDVFAREPDVPEALRALDNVVMTPHAADYTQRAFAAKMAMVRENLRRCFAGEPLLSPVPGSY